MMPYDLNDADWLGMPRPDEPDPKAWPVWLLAVLMVIAAALVLVGAASAAGTLVNGGFESGATGWTFSPWTSDISSGVYNFQPHSGGAVGWVDGHGHTSYACQAVSVDAGDIVTVWYQHYAGYSDPISPLSVTVDGSAVGSLEGGSAGVWYEGVVTSTVSGENLCFTGDAIMLDDVSLTAGEPSEATSTPTATAAGPTATRTPTATATATGPTATPTITYTPMATRQGGYTVTHYDLPSGGQVAVESRTTFGELFVGLSTLLVVAVIGATALPGLGDRLFHR